MSYYTSITIAETVRDAIAAFSDLNAWSQTTFGSLPTIYLGVDEDQPAPESDYPIVGLVNVRRMGALTSNAITWEIDLGCAVLNTELATAGTTKTYTGLLQANYLTELVEQALLQSRLFRTIEFNGESGAIVDFPAFVAYSTLTLGLHASSRSPRFR